MPRSSGGGGPWLSFEAVELEILKWVVRFNNRRLLEPIRNISLAEAEATYYAALEEPAKLAASLKPNDLRRTRDSSDRHHVRALPRGENRDPSPPHYLRPMQPIGGGGGRAQSQLAHLDLLRFQRIDFGHSSKEIFYSFCFEDLSARNSSNASLSLAFRSRSRNASNSCCSS